MDIRPLSYGRSDLEKILAIEADCFPEESKPHFMRQMIDLFPDLTFIAERDGQAQGFVLGAINTAGEAWLLSIATRAAGRRSGIGKLLLERLLQTLQQRGVNSIWLTVDPGNQAAYNFFLDWGWLPTEQIAEYFTTDDQRIVMRRAL